MRSSSILVTFAFVLAGCGTKSALPVGGGVTADAAADATMGVGGESGSDGPSGVDGDVGGAGADGSAPLTETPGCGTFLSNACPRGQFCFGPRACGSVWMCQQANPCSAAYGSPACGCDGRVMHAAGGCPDRHAYLLQSAFGSAHDGMLKNGAPCDPTRRAPFAVRLEISGTMLTPFESGRFWMRTREGSVPGWFPPDGLRVVQGEFAHAAENVPSPNSGSGNYFELLLDLNGDGRCTPGEDLAWFGYPTEVDAEKFIVRFALTAPKQGDGQRCASVWK